MFGRVIANAEAPKKNVEFSPAVIPGDIGIRKPSEGCAAVCTVGIVDSHELSLSMLQDLVARPIRADQTPHFCFYGFPTRPVLGYRPL